MMSDEQISYWREYLGKISRYLGLGEWQIRLMDEPCDEPMLASCQIVRGRRIAHIRLASDFMEHDAYEQRQGIVHELLHVWINPILINVEAASEAMTQSAFKVLYHTTNMQTEYAVDGISAVISQNYPLPSVPA